MPVKEGPLRPLPSMCGTPAWRGMLLLDARYVQANEKMLAQLEDDRILVVWTTVGGNRFIAFT